MRNHVGVIGLSVLWLLWASCATQAPRADPIGKKFVEVAGQSLDGKEYALPGDFSGAPVLFLVGFTQRSQFDIDRWLLGIDQSGLEVAIAEVPTVDGLFPYWFSGVIDNGMRSGIPSEDWAGVITVYDDAESIIRFTGNENGLPARVLLLDDTGHVVFFHDEGYSVTALTSLGNSLENLRAAASLPPLRH